MKNQWEIVREHEQMVVSDTWDIGCAVALGERALQRARSAELPVLIMVRPPWANRVSRCIARFGSSERALGHAQDRVG